MATTNRKAKVTDEHRLEAKALKAIWDQKKPMSQAEFGETFDVGGQSAVSQFLLGTIALSAKAASAFAKALNCKIEEFSPRLASEIANLADRVSDGQPKELEELKEVVTRLTTTGKMQLTEVSAMIAMLKAREGPPSNDLAPDSPDDGSSGRSR